MKRFMRLTLIILTVILAVSVVTPAVPTQAQGGRQVYAYYFGWYSGNSWNDGRLSDRPASPYNSADGGVIARQIGEAQSAGIDAFIMSWFGPKENNLTNIVFGMLLNTSAAMGFHAAASVDMGQGNFNATVGEVTDSMRTLVGNLVNHPGYLRYNGKPVIYFWNQKRFSRQQWADIRAQVDPNHTTTWVLEGTSTAYMGVFDGLYLFNTAWSGNPASTARSYYSRAFGSGGSFYTPTVMPGWDESQIAGRDNPTSPQGRNGGAFLRRSWAGAASSGANTILIVSWNEFLENSYIEPSQKLGSTALDVLRPLISAWKSGRPIPPPAVGSNPNQGGTNGSNTPPDASTGIAGKTITALYDNINIRSGAGTNFTVLGQVHLNDTFTATGESNGWVAFNYNGQTGYILKKYVSIS